ncbi:helix-turn-helix domain-containing protein [Mesorhizobium sp. M0203]|uniref:helix-turn-helix domain-containing protein n=1 Tax=Mesorhizobium sp. M0203 TaxID=2956912 RepID=UPI003337445D
MSVVDFIPIRDISARHAEGWRLINALEPNDYAALMRAPGEPESNTHLAAVSRNASRFAAPAPKPAGAGVRRERLEDEVHELRERLAAIAGGEFEIQNARRQLGLTKAEAEIFLMLVNRGVATYPQIQATIYSFDTLDMINDVGEAIRSHVKRIRKKVRRHGVDFATSYGFGFEMDERMRKAARALLQAVPA